MSTGGPWSGRRLHLIGVGGAGMSAYARAARALGAQVTGSDRSLSPYAERLAADGVLNARIGEHAASNVPAGQDVEVVYSSAVGPENPERVAARERGLRERSRGELLGELTGLRRTIAVAGTHGKTTTCAMVVCALRAAGMAPDWLIGGTVGPGEANASWASEGQGGGEGRWLVVEADESDRSMLMLDVEIAVLTNVELDHHATFASLGEVREAMREFLGNARGAVVVWDRSELLELAPGSSSSSSSSVIVPAADVVAPASDVVLPAGEVIVPAGADGTATSEGSVRVELVPYDAIDTQLTDGGSVTCWRGHEVRLEVPGVHNALNAIAALEAARLAGAEEGLAVAGLAEFSGAGRRMQLLGATASGAKIYDDYAHHPTEVAATLAGARTLRAERVVAVFQPHLYSRTAMFAREFGAALALADAVVVLDVYPARERAEDHPGVSGLLIAQAAADAAGGKPVYWLPTGADAEPVLRAKLRGGDVCVVMGAGDVDRLAHSLVGDGSV